MQEKTLGNLTYNIMFNVFIGVLLVASDRNPTQTNYMKKMVLLGDSVQSKTTEDRAAWTSQRLKLGFGLLSRLSFSLPLHLFLILWS